MGLNLSMSLDKGKDRIPEAGLISRARWSHGLAIVALAFALAGAGLSVAAHRVAYFPIDLSVTRSVQAVDSGWFVFPLGILSTIGFAPVVDVVYGSILVLIFAMGWRWPAMVTAATVILASGVNHGVKLLVARPRPPEDLVRVGRHIHNSSYPAGHVLNLTAFAGLLCYFAWTRLAPSWRRSALVAVLMTLMGLMGLARIEAGEHWMSDVVGGYLFGFVCVAAGIALDGWGEREGWAKRFESRKRVRAGGPRMAVVSANAPSLPGDRRTDNLSGQLAQISPALDHHREPWAVMGASSGAFSMAQGMLIRSGLVSPKGLRQWQNLGQLEK